MRLKQAVSFRADSASGSRPCISLEHVEAGTGRLLMHAELPTAIGSSSGFVAASPGDVLFGKLRPYLAKTILVTEPVYASTELLCLRPSPGVDSKWLSYLMQSRTILEWSVATADGTKMPRTSWEKISQFTFELPPRGAQSAVANFLEAETSRIDALIAKKSRLIDLLHERRDRALERLVLPNCSGDLRRNPADVPLEVELPADWSAVALGHCLKRITYGFTNPMPVAEDGPYMLTANDVGDGRVDYNGARRTTLQAFRHALTDKSRPRVGDTLLTKDGTLGRAAYFDGLMACVNQSVAVLTPRSDRILPELLTQILLVPAYRDALVHNAGGTTIKHLYISRVVKQRIGLPMLANQPALLGAIRAVRESTDAIVDRLQHQIYLLREHRQALITAAVTGELKFPEAGRDA